MVRNPVKLKLMNVLIVFKCNCIYEMGVIYTEQKLY